MRPLLFPFTLEITRMHFGAVAGQKVHATMVLCRPRGEGAQGIAPPQEEAARQQDPSNGTGSGEGRCGGSVLPPDHHWLCRLLTFLGGGHCPHVLWSPVLGLAERLEPEQSAGPWNILS